MTTPASGHWTDGPLPANAALGTGSIISGPDAFKRFRTTHPEGLIVGAHSTIERPQLSVASGGRIIIGDYSLLTAVVLMSEEEIRIGSYVSIGWNTAIADSDFHPIEPALRQQDVIACSLLGKGMERPPVKHEPVVIEDDVWIGPNVTILKGVRIGAGSIIEPGSMITRPVPPRSRVMGNPARLVGEV